MKFAHLRIMNMTNRYNTYIFSVYDREKTHLSKLLEIVTSIVEITIQ